MAEKQNVTNIIIKNCIVNKNTEIWIVTLALVNVVTGTKTLNVRNGILEWPHEKVTKKCAGHPISAHAMPPPNIIWLVGPTLSPKQYPFPSLAGSRKWPLESTSRAEEVDYQRLCPFQSCLCLSKNKPSLSYNLLLLIIGELNTD